MHNAVHGAVHRAVHCAVHSVVSCALHGSRPLGSCVAAGDLDQPQIYHHTLHCISTVLGVRAGKSESNQPNGVELFSDFLTNLERFW